MREGCREPLFDAGDDTFDAASQAVVDRVETPLQAIYARFANERSPLGNKEGRLSRFPIAALRTAGVVVVEIPGLGAPQLPRRHGFASDTIR
jgi:hypothetical protein